MENKTKDPNEQYDYIQIGGRPSSDTTKILGEYTEDGKFIKYNPPHGCGTLVLLIGKPKLCRVIEERLTHDYGYDENSTMRQSKLYTKYHALKQDLRKAENPIPEAVAVPTQFAKKSFVQTVRGYLGL